MDNESIKTNILRFRHQAGLTIAQTAAAMDISEASYKKIEKGATRIIYRYMDRLAAALGVTPEQILLGYEPADPRSEGILGEGGREHYLHTLSDNYEQRLREKDEIIAGKDALIADKDRTIKDLREYIDMQKLLNGVK